MYPSGNRGGSDGGGGCGGGARGNNRYRHRRSRGKAVSDRYGGNVQQAAGSGVNTSGQNMGQSLSRHQGQQERGGSSRRGKKQHLPEDTPGIAMTPKPPPQPPNPTFNFPFLCDEDTVSYIRGSKVMIILRGLPGSGKTTLADEIKKRYRKTKVSLCSADKFFKGRDGVYRWEQHRLQEAHAACRDAATRACAGSDISGSCCAAVIIVDNTNVQTWEMQPYLELALQYNFAVIVAVPRTSWSMNVSELARRNIHNVPLKAVQRKSELWEFAIPRYYAWFLHEADSHMLNTIAQLYLDELGRNADFQRDFGKHISNLRQGANNFQQELHQYFMNHSIEGGQGMLHCTARFCGQEPDQACVSYANSRKIRNSLGRVFSFQIVGFFVTPRTFGARIKLPNETLPLWANDDDESSASNPSAGNRDTSDGDIVSSLSRLRMDDKREDNGRFSHTRIGRPGSSKKDSQSAVPNCIPTLHWSRELLNTERFRPTHGKGSRAHITLGTAPGIGAVSTGLDLVEVVQDEARFGNRCPGNSFLVQKGLACNRGIGRWVVYLDRPIQVKALFTGEY